jgi:DNA-binding GntR family transcriptional regulator
MTLTVDPLGGGADESAARRVQSHLRALVLDGTLPPGSEFSQVELARTLGVSRTPLREALRMLEEEGLVEAEQNRKARISACTPAELDAVYAARVSMEPVGVAVTAQLRSSDLLAELDALLGAMEAVSTDPTAYQPLHRRFHRLLISCAPPMFQHTLGAQQDRAERYWRLLNTTEAVPHTRRDREHRAIVEAVRERDGARAASLLAQHLARTAMTLITHAWPEDDVPATRAALRLRTLPA